MTRALWLGGLLWGVVFSVGVALYPTSVGSRPLFYSIMSVLTAGITVAVAAAYVHGLEGRILWKVLSASSLWVVTCWVLDFVAVSLRSPRFSLREYLLANGLVYLMIPVIALGMAYQRVRFERAPVR